MPLYFFRIRNGRYSGCSEHGTECADRGAAWKELTSVCADMAAGISRKLAENAEWQMDLLDEPKQPVSRIRIGAEPLDQSGPAETGPFPHHEEPPAGPREARPDDKLRGVSKDAATIGPHGSRPR